MKFIETRLIEIYGRRCRFKIYDNCVIAFSGCSQLPKIVDMIKPGEDSPEPAIQRVRAVANRDWKQIITYRLI